MKFLVLIYTAKTDEYTLIFDDATKEDLKKIKDTYPNSDLKVIPQSQSLDIDTFLWI